MLARGDEHGKCDQHENQERGEADENLFQHWGLSPVGVQDGMINKRPFPSEGHAEPAEAQMPTSSKRTRSACASRPGKPMLEVLGMRSEPAPLTKASGMAVMSSRSSSSRRRRTSVA